MSNKHSKDLPKKAATNKVVRDKAFKIVKNPKCDGYQRGIASMVYKVSGQMSAGTFANKETRISFKNHQMRITQDNYWVYSYLRNNIWGADLADTALLSKYDQWIRFLLSLVSMHGFFLWQIKKTF